MKRLLRRVMLLLVRLLGAPGAWAAPKQARKPLSAAPRILLIRPDHLGDMVLTTPVLHALKQHAPNAQITMMVGPWSSEIVARHPDIDHLLTCPFPGFQRAPQRALAPYVLLWTTAKQLRRGQYDVAVNLRPDFWWGAALMYLARIPHRVGYALEPGKPFLTKTLPFHSPEHATVSNLRLASAALEVMGYPPLEEPFSPERYPSEFIPTGEEQRWAIKRLSSEGIDTETPFVIIHPGTGAPVKLWRNEAWASCADALVNSPQWPKPVHILLTGSKNERAMLEEIARKMASPAIIVTDATVGQLAALLGRAQMLLAVDNGPAHIAVAQGTPTVELFGPTDYRIFGPWGAAEKHIVLASTARCPDCPAIPCGRLEFSSSELPAHPCVRLISEQQVLAAAEKLYNICHQKSK
ncbi:MAG TPA: glycosyltransferase family 9 protein [Ktedonobacteraceae bacterium]|nr:glycosyltransferase family 9 protein [Ktedonobacteraceae bacterium]